MRELFSLFFTFSKIGLFTFGGGYAMLPMFQSELVERKHWVTEENLVDYYAIAQCTPGVIAVNTATFVGKKIHGIAGAIFATLGVIAPSIVIITILAAFLQNFADLEAVKHAFAGVRVCVCVLIFNAVVKLGEKSMIDVVSWIVFAVVLAASLFTSIPTAVLVVIAGVAGAIMAVIKNKRRINEQTDMNEDKSNE